jgi:uncharacterized protein
MTFPATTAFYAALLALLYLGLAGWVMAGRLSGNVLHGDGGDDELQKRIRSHANFSEYVPLTVILVGLLEGQGAGPGLVRGLMLALLVGRILHPVGMFAPPNSPRQFACRGGGMLLTMGAMGVAAVLLLVRAA